MTSPHIADLGRPIRRRIVVIGLLRALASTTALVAVYFWWPFDLTSAVPSWITLVVAGVVIVGITTLQVRAIMHSLYPGLRAIEAIAVTVPLFLLLFAAAYYSMALENPANFNVDGLTRVDTLYFTVTVFATVGFGDISAASQSARLMVTVQMILNLIVLGAGIRTILGVVQRSRESHAAESA